MADNDTLLVLGATYDNSDVEVSDYEAVKEFYREVKTSHDFDAAVVAKDPDGKVRIVKKHEQPTRHGAAVGLGWGPGHRGGRRAVPAGRHRHRRRRGRRRGDRRGGRTRHRRDAARRPEGPRRSPRLRHG